MSKNATYYWLEAEEAGAAQAPTTDPAAGGLGNAGQGLGGGQQPDDQAKLPPAPSDDKDNTQDDISQDPQHPDMPDHGNDKDFEQWLNDFFKLAIKGDAQEMIDACKQVRDRDLDATQRKQVEDNLHIQWLRQDANVDKVSKAVRKLVKNQIDKNYPGTSLMQHICASLEEMPQLNEVFYKLTGYYGMKGDLHRKFIAAILCAVQLGGGGSREDIVYCEKNFSVNLSTRMSTEWGEIALGKWGLQVDDPERYLEEPELARLTDGAPEERTVLRHRVVLSSIAERFKTRAFIIHVVNPDGKIQALGWDLGDSIMAGYREGRLVVRTKASEAAEAMIDDDGNVIPISDLTIRYIKQSGRRDDTGSPIKREVEFMERINGMLYLTAELETIRDMQNLQGVFMKEIPFNGNPSDIQMFQRCIPSLTELLMRKC